MTSAAAAMLIRIAAVAALLAALVWAEQRIEQRIEQRGYDRAQAEYSAAIARQKAQAAALLASEIAQTRTAEQALQALKNTQDRHDADHKKTISDLSDRLRGLAGPAEQLRDPHAAGCGPGGAGPTGDAARAAGAGAADAAQAGGLLSVPLSELLRAALREADDINAAYASCRADAYAVRAPP